MSIAHRIASSLAAVVIGFGATQTLRADMIAQWTFNETSGNALDTGTGADSDAALVNGASRSDEGATRYVHLDRALSQYADAGDTAELQLTSAGAVMVWLRVNDNSDFSLFSDEPGFGKPFHYGFTVYTSGAYGYAGAGSYNTGVAPFSAGSWHQLTMTWSNTTGLAELYVDGVMINSNAAELDADVTNNSGVSFRIGVGYSTPGYFLGDVDEVRVYDTALDATDILNAYNDGPVPLPEPMSLGLLTTGLTLLVTRRRSA